MKVLITHSYFLHFDKKQLELSKPYPPLATLLAASVLRNHSLEVHFYDVSFDETVEKVKEQSLNIL